MSTTQHNQALAQIEQMQQVLQGNNKLLFSGRKTIVIGVILCLVPLFELGFSHLLANMNLTAQILWRVIFYYLISLIGVKLVSRKQIAPSPLPQTLQKAVELHSLILKTLVLLNIALAFGGYSDLILPLDLILIGLVYNLLGRFTLKLLSYVSLSYILIGVVVIGLNNHLASNVWLAEIYYLGITYIIMGIFLERNYHA